MFCSDYLCFINQGLIKLQTFVFLARTRVMLSPNVPSVKSPHLVHRSDHLQTWAECKIWVLISFCCNPQDLVQWLIKKINCASENLFHFSLYFPLKLCSSFPPRSETPCRERHFLPGVLKLRYAGSQGLTLTLVNDCALKN